MLYLISERPVSMSAQRSAVPLTPAAPMLTMLCCVRSESHAEPPLAAFAASRMATGSGRGVATFCASANGEHSARTTAISESAGQGERKGYRRTERQSWDLG